METKDEMDTSEDKDEAAASADPLQVNGEKEKEDEEEAKKENKKEDAEEDGDDPVVHEMPVFLAKRLKEQLYLFQVM